MFEVEQSIQPKEEEEEEAPGQHDSDHSEAQEDTSGVVKMKRCEAYVELLYDRPQIVIEEDSVVVTQQTTEPVYDRPQLQEDSTDVVMQQCEAYTPVLPPPRH